MAYDENIQPIKEDVKRITVRIKGNDIRSLKEITEGFRQQTEADFLSMLIKAACTKSRMELMQFIFSDGRKTIESE